MTIHRLYDRIIKQPMNTHKLDKSMAMLARGDKDAFEQIYADTDKAVYYTALSILREKSLAEDAVQTAYLRVIENASSYRAGTDPRAWILRITRNTALDIKRKRSREFAIDADENEHMFGTSAPDEYGALIDAARRCLDDDEFEILMLVAVSGYKRREISELLDMPTATVTWKYNNAAQKLRNVFNDI